MEVQIENDRMCSYFAKNAVYIDISALWSGCCLFDTFPISILNFIKNIMKITRTAHFLKLQVVTNDTFCMDYTGKSIIM